MDINSDLGESYGAWRMGDDAAMLDIVTSANVACGFHAGDPAGILHTLNQAYSNLYDNLLSDVALDVSSEIAALQGMLANDGLTGEGLQ